jgi:hypothetical protein
MRRKIRQRKLKLRVKRRRARLAEERSSHKGTPAKKESKKK